MDKMEGYSGHTEKDDTRAEERGLPMPLSPNAQSCDPVKDGITQRGGHLRGLVAVARPGKT